jgi:hypothetical protein
MAQRTPSARLFTIVVPGPGSPSDICRLIILMWLTRANRAPDMGRELLTGCLASPVGVHPRREYFPAASRSWASAGHGHPWALR